MTAPVLTAAGALEVTLHGWDVSVACGAPRQIPDRLAAHLAVLAPVLVTEADRPVRFGPRAFLGRDPPGTDPAQTRRRPWPQRPGPP